MPEPARPRGVNPELEDSGCQGGNHLTLEQLDAAAVVRRLREVVDRVAQTEITDGLQLLDHLFRRTDPRDRAGAVFRERTS